MRVFVPVEDEIPTGLTLVPYRIGMALLSYSIEAPSPAERAAVLAPPRIKTRDDAPMAA